jgi:hypothetical protein
MASIIKVDNIQKTSDGSNIIKKCGSTITIGSSGQTVAVACGATTSGMGRTGTVDWCTTAKTSPFTAVSGDGYFVNTTSGAVTVTLPASPSAGDIVAVQDYAGTWETNNVTLCRNGSNIGGQALNATLSTSDTSFTFVYVDGTRGWQTVNDSTQNICGATFICASGGSITTCGDYKIHTYTANGTFTVNSLGNCAGGGSKVSYMVVAGGGGGGGTGAGGAGGFREGKCSSDPYTASPLAATPCSGLTVSVQAYPITVGAGGSTCCNGSNSVFSTITSAGGGAGGNNPATPNNKGASGGSGGGGNQGASTPSPNRPATGGAGNTPPVSPSQGNDGGDGLSYDNTGAGGGGGATSAGGDATGPGSAGSNGVGGAGGNGAGTGINPSASVGDSGPDAGLRYFAGGGGGSHYGAPVYSGPATPAPGGYGGGGNGGIWSPPSLTGQTDGTANTGGGAGGKVSSNTALGGSGIVIIRYKFQ